MLFHVEPKHPAVPIYEQIVEQVTFAVASGVLKPGALIPSVRELAASLTVHPNTVAKAFQDLERRGLVTAVRGKGMAVTDDGPDLARGRRSQLVRDRVRAALRDATASGLSRADVLRLVEDELALAETPTHHSADTHVKGKR